MSYCGFKLVVKCTACKGWIKKSDASSENLGSGLSAPRLGRSDNQSNGDVSLVNDDAFHIEAVGEQDIDECESLNHLVSSRNILPTCDTLTDGVGLLPVV